MSHGSFQSLPLEIRDYILTLVPDYYTLRCAVLSSRCVCNTFLSRRRTIMREVGLSEIAPALPWAFALVRMRYALEEEPLQVVVEGLTDTSPDSAYWNIDISGKEAKALSAVSAATRRLESFFCVRYKDRTALTSTLSEVESLRFHRAIYRTWIMAVLLEGDRYQYSDIVDKGIGFLTDLCERELAELREVEFFLGAIFSSSELRGSLFDGYRLPLCVAPDIVQTATRIRVSVDPYTNPFRPPFLYLANYRRLLSMLGSVTTPPGRFILTKYRKCSRRTAKLFGENNWHLLQYFLNLDDLLPGRIAGNDYLVGVIGRLIPCEDSLQYVLGNMFDSQNDPESKWEKSDWLCINCVKEFWRERLLSWVIDQLVKDGHELGSNCRYGYNCCCQTHNKRHAEKLNHLCEPVDHDATVCPYERFSRTALGISDDMWNDILRERQGRGAYIPKGIEVKQNRPKEQRPGPSQKIQMKDQSCGHLNLAVDLKKPFGPYKTLQLNLFQNEAAMDTEVRAALERDSGDLGDEEPMDYRTFRNFLESFKSQAGLAGPVSSLVGRLEPWWLPREES
ncbi:uncharacterized protein FOMMEDRAFT_155474 [Fomitiporia mediterranea MF3/22]|uniref:uncharacterized protein n=1 Tax=Fomitiporia mediterranea (strain MF3/22) TaxID=694068 RepID=UPI0004408016|nr:uncharacterized protein FOMMEDRAFT_155474 [Fomitiporia mediterranea MF3/22]EJD04342.1 hypothetical protein FOMMEDRAFT_155474 [Fomitiporia mediterranea MF3/22]